MMQFGGLTRSNIGKQVLFLGFLGGCGLAAAMWTAAQQDAQPIRLGAFAGLTIAFLLFAVLPLRLPQGDRVQVGLVVAVIGISLCGVGEVLAAAGAAALADLFLARTEGSSYSTGDRVLDAVRRVAVIALLSPFQLLMRPLTGDAVLSDIVLLDALLCGIAFTIVDLLTLAVQQSISRNTPQGEGFMMLARPLASVYTVHMAMGAIALRIYPLLGVWGLVITLLLTSILQNSFSLYLGIRRAYAQTIGVLARAIELDRPETAGHAQRVADLSVAVARDLGLKSAELERLDYAAYLHDIGRLGSESSDEDAACAVRGAKVVEGIPFLEGVSELIAGHRAGEDEQAPLGAAILNVCCRYDSLRSKMGVSEAIAQLKDQEGDRKREIVGCLERIVKRQGEPKEASKDAV